MLIEIRETIDIINERIAELANLITGQFFTTLSDEERGKIYRELDGLQNHYQYWEHRYEWYYEND